MRPQSIIRFEQFYLASTALTLIAQMFNAMGLIGPVSKDQLGPYFLPILFVISYGLAFLFWFLIAHRASNVAKWILVVLTGISVAFAVPALAMLTQEYPVYVLVTGLLVLLDLIAMVYLFRRDAVEWLKSRGQQAPIDVTTFN